MMPAFGEYLGERMLRDACHWLFDRLPGLSADTALVCANDRVARFYYEHTGSGGATPHPSAVIVGFDNRFPATYYRFTSYSFNEQALFSSAFSYILHPEAWRDTGPFVRREGTLAQRQRDRGAVGTK